MTRRFHHLPSGRPRPCAGGGPCRPLFGLGLLLGLSLLAEPAAKAQTGGPTPGASPTAIPLDGGASLLLIGGMGYALRRLRRKPKS